MLNPYFVDMLKQDSAIFQLVQAAQARAKEIGMENVFDFSMGNPSVPVNPKYNEDIIKAVQSGDPRLHAYTPAAGLYEARAAVAKSLSENYGLPYKPEHIFMTVGCNAALEHSFRAIGCPGEEVLTFAPCFTEYVLYTYGAGLKLKVVPANLETFQINLEAFEEMLNPNVCAVLINSPNNPSGVVYSTETIDKLAAILRAKGQEYGHPIYLVSDEPYRDLVFEGVDSPYIAAHYENTLTCYSYSKSLSIPGDRLGYLAVCPNCEDAEKIIQMCTQISRCIGFNGVNTVSQLAIIDNITTFSDLSVYEKNKNILYPALTEMGYEMVEPGGTFYLFPKALEPDANAFSERAKQFDLMLVPSDTFGVTGYFRIGHCVPTEKVERSLPAFKKLAQSYGL